MKIEPIQGGGEADALLEAARRLRNAEPFVMVTIVAARGSTPRKEGARMLVDPAGKVFGTIGGAAVERIAVERAQVALQTRRTERLELDLDDLERLQTGMVCGGSVELLIEPFGAGPRLYLFGAGHVAQPTARLAAETGFNVTVLDDRAAWATPVRFPSAQLRVDKLETLAESLNPTPDDFIAIMTYCHDDDYLVLTRLLRKPFFYLGVIGSRRKAVEIRRRLEADGFQDVEIAKLTCPIGLDINSHTPAEIAVAIAAQLIQKRSDWLGRPGS